MQPCKNGCCNDLSNGDFVCYCQNGYTGKKCEIGETLVKLILQTEQLMFTSF